MPESGYGEGGGQKNITTMMLSIRIAKTLRALADWIDPYYTMGEYYKEPVTIFTVDRRAYYSWKIKGISISIPEGSTGTDIVSFEDTFLIWYDPCGMWIPARADGRITGWSTLVRWEPIPSAS